jgi:hypothetical protein
VGPALAAEGHQRRNDPTGARQGHEPLFLDDVRADPRISGGDR